MRQLIVYGLDRIDPEKDIKIELIEAADRILPALPERLSTAAAKLLQNLGVRVRTSSKVAEVLSTGVRLATGAFHSRRARGLGGRCARHPTFSMT